MENSGIKLVCINYKKSDSGNKVKQKLLKKLGKAVDNKQTAGVKNVHGIKTESVLQVAFNINYLVLLLKDGRVCRVKCAGNSDVAEGGNGYEPVKESFQVASDLEYARVLQRQYDTEGTQWDFSTMDRDHSYLVTLSDPLSSCLYDTLPHVEHHSSINIPTFDPNPFEEEIIDISTPFRARKHYSSPNRDYGRMKSFNKSSRNSYPKLSSLEWLTIEQDNCGSVGFVAMAVMHSEILLVDGLTRQLFSWSCEPGITIATSHRLTQELGLQGECIVQLGSSDVRATLVTESGKMATFYDQVLQSTSGTTPSLISLLGHSCQQMLGQGEVVKDMTVNDFYTAIVTDCGRVYWWGLSPQEGSSSKGLVQTPVNLAKEKQKKLTIGSRVSLKSGPNYGLNMPVFHSSTTLGPRLGYTVDSDEHSLFDPKVSVLVSVCTNNAGTERSNASSSFDTPSASREHSGKKCLEVWSRSQVTFLDNPTPLYGEVIAIDQQQAVVKLENGGPDRLAVKILKLSELEVANVAGLKSDLENSTLGSSTNDSISAQPTSSTKISSFTKHIAGIIQHKPLCLLDASCQWKPAESFGMLDAQSGTMVTGFRPITIHATKDGIMMLVERMSDLKTFLMFPAAMTTGLVRGSSYVATGNGTNYPNKCTLEEDAVTSTESGFVSSEEMYIKELESQGNVSLVNKVVLGKKRKHFDDSVNDSNKLCSSTTTVPQLVTCMDSNLLLVKNAHGIVSLLSEGSQIIRSTDGIHSDDVINQPMSNIVISHRAVTKETNSIVVAIVPKVQQLLPAIQQGDIAAVVKVMEQLSVTRGGGSKGKDLAGKPGVGKKIRLDTGSHDPTQARDSHMLSGHQVLLECSTDNNNILHVCCSMATGKGDVSVNDRSDFSSVEMHGDNYQCITMKEELKSYSLEELRYRDVQGVTPTLMGSKESVKRHLSLSERQLEILDILLKSSCVRSTVNYLLCCRNQYGRTPFLHAILQRNYAAALKIMEHVTSSVMNSSDDPMGEIIEGTLQPSDFFTRAILAPCSKGLTPLHAFFASIKEVYDSLMMCLHVSGLPSGYTAQQLLRYFQLQFPSAYRAEVFHDSTNDKSTDSEEEEEDEDRDNSQDHDADHEQSSAFHAPRSKRMRTSSPPLRGPGDAIICPEAVPLLTAAEMRRYRDRNSRRRRPPRYASTGIFARVGGTGFVYFSDIHQLRAALVELDNTTISSSSHAPGGGPFFGTSTTAHSMGRISVRLVGTGTAGSLDTEESDSEEDEAADDKNSDVHKAKASFGSALSDLKKLRDIIVASKKTCSSTLSQTTTLSTKTTEQQNALSLFTKLLEYPQIVTAKDLGGETVLASLVHNPTCLKALKSYFSCKTARPAPKKLPRSNPYRMPSALKSSRGRHSLRHYNPHNIESLLMTPNASTTDTSAGKANNSTVEGVTQQNPSEIIVPLSEPEETSSDSNVRCMVNQLLTKHVKNELSKDTTEKLQTTTSPLDVTATKTVNSTTSVNTSDTPAEDIPEVQAEDNVTPSIERLSPLFPSLSGEEDSKSREDKIPVTHTGHSGILLSLTTDWSLIVTTILGICVPSCGEEPRGISTDNRVEYNSQACDYFIQELLYNCDYTVAECLADTIISKLNYGLAGDQWTLDSVLQLEDESVAVTEDNVALIVAKKFLHSLVRLLAIELSDPVIGGEETNERANKNKSAIVLIQKLLSKFSWLAVKCVADAAVATSSPVCLGVCKPMIAASVSSDHNLIRSAAMRHSMAMGLPSMERYQQSSLHKRRVHVKQCFPTKITPPKATLPLGGVRMVPSCGQEEMEMNSFETDPGSLDGDEQTTHSIDSEDSQQYSTAVVLSPPPRPQAPSPDASLLVDIRDAVVPSPDPAMEDEEYSSMDDEEEYTMLVNQGILRPGSADPSDDYIQVVPMPFRVGRFAGGGRGEAAGESREEQDDIYPFAWALDGRNVNENASHNHPRPTTPLFGLPSEPINHMLQSVPSLRFGAGFLARSFCRLTKEMVDLAVNITSTQYVSPEHHSANKEAEVMSLQLPKAIKEGLIASSTMLLQPTWQWLVKVLDVAQGQLEQGELFDTTSYVMSLKARGHQHSAGMARPIFPGSPGGLGHSGSSPADHLMYLLRTHTAEQHNCLPVLDLIGYEHVVYMLDALMYSLSKWPREMIAPPPSSSTSKECSGDSSSTVMASSSDRQPLPQSSTATPSSTISRFFQRTQSITLNYSNDADEDGEIVAANSSFNRSITEEIPLAQQPHLLEPFLKKEEQAATIASRRRQSSCYKLPLSYSRSGMTSGEDQQGSIVSSWSMEDALQRWQTVIKVFAHIFLAAGPGNERDNFLNPHAGFASRMARFRHKVAHYLETNAMHRDRSWGGLSVGDPHVLSIRVRRSHLLQDSLQLLASCPRMQYSQVRVKFEGEDGSGPGVNRGFFASFATALKNPAKECLKVGVLLYEPGKKPEQSGLYSPSPVDSCSVTQPSRINHFRAIGRFLGLALLFRYNIPLMLCRHVAKYLIGRELSWHDVAFYNADLYEGLRRMIRDVESDKNSAEDFQATYCCYFEVTHCGRVIELIPGGSRVPVTPDRVHEYVHLYAMYKMVGCVQNELNSMRDGLHDVIPLELLSGLAAEDFQLLLCGGSANITMKRLKSIIKFQHTYTHPHTRGAIEKFERMFWKVVSHMNNKQRQQLLYFATGSAGLPANSETESGLTISVDVIGSGNTESLPVASTCGQRMSIPLYPSYHMLKKKLLQAIQCQAYGLS